MNIKSIGTFVIASALVWAFMIIGCSLKLSGSDCYEQISLILIGGFIFHLLFIWGPLAVQVRKLNKVE